MNNEQKNMLSRAIATVKTWASVWVRVICVILVYCITLQGSPAQAQTVWYHNDTGGSAVAATNAAGNLVWRESYRPYGERMLKPATANTQWFHGKQVDPDTGMSDFGARNYDPLLGRFLSIDPVDFTDKNIHSFSRYAYGNNNPLKYKDPDGNFPVLLIAAMALKAADIALTAHDVYSAFRSDGLSGAGRELAFAAAMGAIPGGRMLDKGADAARSLGRNGALNEIKKDLNIPRSQHPDSVKSVPMTSSDGKNILNEKNMPTMTREYTYTRPDGTRVVIQDHSAGHKFNEGGKGDQGSHFNVRPPEDTRHGTVEGTRSHYDWGNR